MIRPVRALLLAGALGAAACTADNPDYTAPDGGTPGGATFTPSHIGRIWFDQGKASLIIRNAIDTGKFTVDGQTIPRGVVFGESDGLAVLAANDVSIPAGANVRVTGPRPLVIVASSQITVEGPAPDDAVRAAAPRRSPVPPNCSYGGLSSRPGLLEIDF